jgi:hypothetical protein
MIDRSAPLRAAISSGSQVTISCAPCSTATATIIASTVTCFLMVCPSRAPASRAAYSNTGRTVMAADRLLTIRCTAASDGLPRRVSARTGHGTTVSTPARVQRSRTARAFSLPRDKAINAPLSSAILPTTIPPLSLWPSRRWPQLLVEIAQQAQQWAWVNPRRDFWASIELEAAQNAFYASTHLCRTQMCANIELWLIR